MSLLEQRLKGNRRALRPMEPRLEQTPRDREADALEQAKQHVRERLLRLSEDKAFEGASGDELRRRVEAAVREILRTSRVQVPRLRQEDLVRQMVDEVAGFGPIQAQMDDPAVTEVMINGPGPGRVWIERDGQLEVVEGLALTTEQIRWLIDKIVAPINRRVDESSPTVDARMPDGSRVHIAVRPVALDGPYVTIRKFRKALTIERLIEFGTIPAEVVERFLVPVVRGKASILVAGGTGSGKTSLLNALSSFIPANERIITIEDAAELQLQQPHVVRLESRQPNLEGKGAVPIRDLVRNALRMRPDRIVVGEVRGGEALDLLQAMNTGHEGSLSTIHCNSPQDAITRLETLTLMAGEDLPSRAIREQIASAIDLIVFLRRLPDGRRRVTQITEVTGIGSGRMEGKVLLNDLYRFDLATDRLVPAGRAPRRLVERLRVFGVELDPALFGIHAALNEEGEDGWS